MDCRTHTPHSMSSSPQLIVFPLSYSIIIRSLLFSSRHFSSLLFTPLLFSSLLFSSLLFSPSTKINLHSHLHFTSLHSYFFFFFDCWCSMVVVLSLGEAIWSPRCYDYTMSIAPEVRLYFRLSVHCPPTQTHTSLVLVLYVLLYVV